MRAGAPVLAGRSPAWSRRSAATPPLYVDPRDPEDLARALERLAADPALRADALRARSQLGRGALVGGVRRAPTSRPIPAAALGSADDGSRSSAPAGSPRPTPASRPRRSSLPARLTARGHEVVVYCRPARGRPPAARVEGRAPGPPARRCATSTSTRSCTRSCPRCTRRVGCAPTSRCCSSPATRPMCLITRGAGHPDRHQRRRPRLRPLASGRRSAKAYLRFAERNAPRWADEAHHRLARGRRRSSSAATGARIGVVPYGVEDPGHDGTETLERLGLEPRKLHPLRRAPGAREQPARARRGVLAHRRRAGAAA